MVKNTDKRIVFQNICHNPNGQQTNVRLGDAVCAAPFDIDADKCQIHRYLECNNLYSYDEYYENKQLCSFIDLSDAHWRNIMNACKDCQHCCKINNAGDADVKPVTVKKKNKKTNKPKKNTIKFFKCNNGELKEFLDSECVRNPQNELTDCPMIKFCKDNQLEFKVSPQMFNEQYVHIYNLPTRKQEKLKKICKNCRHKYFQEMQKFFMERAAARKAEANR